jgi:hypothetical protein
MDLFTVGGSLGPLLLLLGFGLFAHLGAAHDDRGSGVALFVSRTLRFEPTDRHVMDLAYQHGRIWRRLVIHDVLVGGWRCLFHGPAERRLLLAQQRRVVGFGQPIAALARQDVMDGVVARLLSQSKVFVAAPHDSDAVGFPQHRDQERRQHQQGQVLGAQFQQLVAEGEVVPVLGDQAVDRAQVAEVAGGGQPAKLSGSVVSFFFFLNYFNSVAY